MAVFEWGKCGKATLLHKCGEMLFGCSGKMLVTQGIYVPKLVSSQPFYLLCKRTVWVPDSLSYECLFEHLLSFGAILPFSVKKIASLNRFGLCGINPTRTVHANDRCFLLLAKYPGKHFAVYGVVEIEQGGPRSMVSIQSIITKKGEVLSHVDCIQSEITHYQQSKESKNKKSSDELVDEKSDQGGQPTGTGCELQAIEQGVQQNIMHHDCVTTEYDIVTTAGIHSILGPCEGFIPQNAIFNGSCLPSNYVIQIPCFPL